MHVLGIVNMNEAERKKRGVLAVVGSSVAIFWPGALIFGFPGVMGPYWQKLFGVGRGAIGNTLFFVLAASGFFMFFVGRWQERYGIKRMITIGSILCSLSLLVIAYASSLYLLYFWAFLIGTSICFIYIPSLTTVQRWYPGRRGLVSGIVNLLFGFSAAIMSPVFNYMLKSMGYLSMNIAVAIVSLVVGIVAARFTEGPEGFQSSPRSGSKGEVKPTVEISESLNGEGKPSDEELLVSLAHVGTSRSSRDCDGDALNGFWAIEGVRHGIRCRRLNRVQYHERSWPARNGLSLRPDGPKLGHEHHLLGCRGCLFCFTS